MVNAGLIIATSAADLAAIFDTQSDLIILVNRLTAVSSGTMPMPSSPIRGQLFIVTSKVDITSLTMNPQGKTINGNISYLPANTSVAWIFGDENEANEWFPYINPFGAKAFPIGSIGIPFYSRVSGSNATTTGQALVDITGLTAALIPNAVYEFEANMSCSVSAVTTGISYGIQYSAAGATVEAIVTGASSTTASKSERISVLNTASTAFLASSGQNGGVRITGTIITGANAGNLTMRHLKITSGTSTVFINSFLKVTRVQ